MLPVFQKYLPLLRMLPKFPLLWTFLKFPLLRAFQKLSLLLNLSAMAKVKQLYLRLQARFHHGLSEW